MKRLYPSIGLGKLCRLFGKTRQAFYDHSWRGNDEQFQEAIVIDLVKQVRKSLPKVGTLKLIHMLKDDLDAHGISIGRDRFFALLKKYHLLVKRKKRYAVTTDSNHPYKKWADMLKGLSIQAPEQVWVSDITYLRTTHNFIYLSLITDAYSRKIVGHHLSQNLKAQGCLISLNKALSTRTTNQPLIHHSDRGIQYCCEPYVATLQQNNIAISMTQDGSPYDNALAERVNGILKTELNLSDTFRSYSDAIQVVHQAIDAYNRLRPHMSIDNLTPNKAHYSPLKLQKRWKNKPYRKAKSVLL